MKGAKRICWAFLVVASFQSQGQTDTSMTSEEQGALANVLPPLTMLIDSALANSPDMIMADASMMQSEYAVQLAKEDWTELVSVNGRYTYGQFVVSDAIGFGLSDPRGGYQVFAGLRVPLSYFVSRKERIGALEAGLRIQEARKLQSELAVKEQVIETYNDLLLLQKLISISAEARESALLQYQMAEERFREGEISLEELGNSTDMRAKLAADYERLRNDFRNLYAELERLVGVPFSKFPR